MKTVYNFNKTLLVFDIDNTLNTKDTIGNIDLIPCYKNIYSKIVANKNTYITYNTTRGIFRIKEILSANNETFYGSGIISSLNGGLIYNLNMNTEIKSELISESASNFLAKWYLSNFKSITFMAIYSTNDIFGKVFIQDKNEINKFYEKYSASFNYDKNRCVSDPEIVSKWISKNNNIMLEFRIKPDTQDCLKMLKKINQISLTYDGLFYINSVGVDKGSGLKLLKNELFESFDQLDTVVAGDSLTDSKMFSNKNKLNIAVGNKISANSFDTEKFCRVQNPNELCTKLGNYLKL